jgi:hypothetical protein
VGKAVGLVAGGAVAGIIAAAGLPALAANSSGSSSSGSTSSEARPNANPDNPTGDPSKPLRSDETLLTGDVAQKVRDAALAAVPGATIQRVETDADGDKYEAHIVKSDGSLATVKVDANFKVTRVETGGPGHGHGRGDGDGDGPGSGETSG